MKRWCAYCETAMTKPAGWGWIHDDCFNRLLDQGIDLERIKSMIKEGKTIDDIKVQLKKMEAFDKRWEGTVKILRQHGIVDKPSIEIIKDELDKQDNRSILLKEITRLIRLHE